MQRKTPQEPQKAPPGRLRGCVRASPSDLSMCPKGFATHHDNGGVRWKLLATAGGGGRHGGGTGQLLVAQLVHAVREALHLAHRQQHGGVLGLDRQHLALGVQRGDLLLVAADLLRQLLSKHSREEPPSKIPDGR